ncbi:MAG: D-alanyl-D-alanine carboxypeptidase/D-alanyl-D-alanine-endopeptidase [Ignavibacteria bacterium]|nr:D-alanyl-D-alanine carboxypeptidase/D-alanyl-D-alanine-endopeptidase [Ignavibacteria bacterium]
MKLLKSKLIKIAVGLLLILIVFQFFNISSTNYLYSQRNVFTSEDSLKSINFLRRQIYEVLKNFNDNKTNYGIVVYSLDKNEFYFRHNIDSYFIPASLTKLFTTFAALSKLGKDYKVKTFIYSDGEIKNGVLEGNLYIYGTGDALFSISDLDEIVDRIKQFGIKKIKGSIYADPSFFDSQTDRFVYSGDFDVVQKTQPITSISIQKNIVKVIVTAGSIYGRSVNVQIFPSTDAIKVYNTAKVSRSLGNRIKDEDADNIKYGGKPILAQRRPPQSREDVSRKAFKVTSEIDKNGLQAIYISGGLSAGTTKTYEFFMENPPLVVASALKKRLETDGIEIAGNFGIANVPFEKSQLIALVSRNIVDILKEMNKESDNYLAETVFKIIGAVEKRMTSNSKEAVRYIFSLLDSLKVPCVECKMFDGSGLSRRNRFSPESIIQILINAKRNPNISFLDTLLSVAGYDGTLKVRMLGTSAQGKVFAKTGTHSNASGLAGYVKTRDNERLAFVFMYNGEKAFQFKKIEDELCIILSEFFYANYQE